jgi:hypothetical protein
MTPIRNFLAALLLPAFREPALVRLLSDPRVVVLYATGLGQNSLKRVKALGGRRAR